MVGIAPNFLVHGVFLRCAGYNAVLSFRVLIYSRHNTPDVRLFPRNCLLDRTPRGYSQDSSPSDDALPYTWVDVYEDGLWVAAH